MATGCCCSAGAPRPKRAHDLRRPEKPGRSRPQPLEEAERSLGEHGPAATTPEHYLPELHDFPGLRREIARHTVLSVVEKMVSPIPGSRLLIGVTHRPFLESVLGALVRLGVEHALAFQAIEGSDEARSTEAPHWSR